jgi:AcrR family transcriptional regulator
LINQSTEATTTSRAETAERRKGEILDAALRVFADKGFHLATNKDIAEAAGIASPGLIYHYFRDKRDLLLQVMERVNPALQLVSSPGDFATLPLREGLLRFAQAFLRMGADPGHAAVVKVVLREALQDPETGASFFQAGPGRGLAFLSCWLQSHVDAGRLRPLPPLVLARQFVGPLMAAILLSAITGQPQSLTPDLADMAVDCFLKGVMP